MKRSNAPIFWSLFGAGGMLAALTGPLLVFVTGIAAPLGWFFPRDLMSHAHMLSFAQHWMGKAFIFAVVSLFLWHGAHRIFHTLHDLGIHTGTFARLICYGIPLVVTLSTAIALLAL